MPQCGSTPVKAVRGFPTIAPWLEHICAGGGGSVAIMVVLYDISEGTLYYGLKLFLLVGMLWADDIGI